MSERALTGFLAWTEAAPPGMTGCSPEGCRCAGP